MTYNEFIQSIKESRENKYFKYSERHHIIPRCLGGTDDEDNLIYLTYEEHFTAHKLLHEENPENRDLLLPILFYMKGNNEMTPDEYACIRKEFIESQTGENNPMYGKRWNHSPESISKISEALKKYNKTPEHCNNISISRKGKCLGDDNIMRTPEHRERQSKLYESLPEDHPMKKHSGEDSPLYGCHYTWMTNGIDNRRASDDIMIESLREQGYYEGFTQHINRTEACLESRKKGRSKALYKRHCKICGKEFESKSGNAKYCGCHLK